MLDSAEAPPTALSGEHPTVGRVNAQIVFVHGIRTSASMWRSQLEYLREHGYTAHAVDLPAHGTRRGGAFTLDEAMRTIDTAVRRAAENGPVLLVGHSLGGLLCLAYAGSGESAPIAGLVAASCTALPLGAGLAWYRGVTRVTNMLPDQGLWISGRMLAATIPVETRSDFGAGGYALDAQDAVLRSLAHLDLATSVARIDVPLWFVNGQWDQLRVNERLFQRLAPHAELIVVPRTTHLVTAMRPRVFNAALRVALATVETGTGVRRAS